MNSDPAVEAAERAWVTRYTNHTHTAADSAQDNGVGQLAIDVAREALKPIRELLDQLAEDTVPPCEFGNRHELYVKAISALSPLVYTTEELEAGP